MRSPVVALMIVGLSVAMISAVSSAQSVPSVAACQRIAWQYKLLSPFEGVPLLTQMKAAGNWQDYRSIVERVLTEAGADGWEAVGIMPGNDQVKSAVLLKRMVCL